MPAQHKYTYVGLAVLVTYAYTSYTHLRRNLDNLRTRYKSKKIATIFLNGCYTTSLFYYVRFAITLRSYIDNLNIVLFPLRINLDFVVPLARDTRTHNIPVNRYYIY